MIEKMEKVCIYALKENIADIMEQLIKCGVMQPEMAEKMISQEIREKLYEEEAADLSKEEEMLQSIEDCIKILENMGEKRTFLHKRPVVAYEELTSEKTLSDSLVICRQIRNITKKIDDTNKKLMHLRSRKSLLLPWTSFDIEPETEMGSVCMSFYIFRDASVPDNAAILAQKQDIALHLEKISEVNGGYYTALIFLKGQEKKIGELMSCLGGQKFSQMPATGSVKDEICAIEDKIYALEKVKKEYTDKLRRMADKIYIPERGRDFLYLKLMCKRGCENTMSTEQVSIITGWVPKAYKPRLEKSLRKYVCFCQYDEPEKGEEPPVLIKNSTLVEPFGAVTEMYSMPSPYSVDTNWAIGLFFFIFFGMMLSDAGYGLILTAAGLFGSVFLDVGEESRRIMRMIGICGISAVFWGILYGSWFGNAVPVIGERFFGSEIHVPYIIDPLESPIEVLLLSFALGIIQLFTGMAIRAYIMIRRGDRWGAIFDVGFWYMVLGGLLITAVAGSIRGIGMTMAAAGAVGLILTQGRHKKGLVGRIGSGIISLYGITGYFSDVLSYSRILALGLATGVVAGAVNTMASMVGEGVLGAVLFIIIFGIGHMLNLGINALGAYVHAARLQYVEFFGKYYEGGGRKFRPLKIETKYVRVMGEK